MLTVCTVIKFDYRCQSNYRTLELKTNQIYRASEWSVLLTNQITEPAS